MSQTRPWLLRIWRLLALGLAAWLLHAAAKKPDAHTVKAAVSLEVARHFFPKAVQLSPSEQESGGDGAFDEHGRLIGILVTTSPQADSIIGYAGPNKLLVAMDRTGRITGAELIASGDTEAHIAKVKIDQAFWKSLIGWKPAQEPMPKVEAVTGSTLTCLGIAEAIQKRLAGRVDALRFPEPLTLKEVQALFPEAQTFELDEAHHGWYEVKDGARRLLGYAVRTSPLSDYTHGHSGPTESLVGVTPDGKKVLGVRLRRSYDSEDYVDSVREDADYLRQLTNFTVEQWARLDFKKAGLEGVSGATETSFAVAEGIRRRFAADVATPVAKQRLFKTRDWILLGIVAGGLVMAFTHWRGVRPVRFLWQAVLIGIFGIGCGDLLSMALLVGWARNGLAWKIAPSLVLLAATALLIPWATRRQIYCHQLCPHGAAQEWLGRFKKLHLKVPQAWSKYLSFLPATMLIAAFVLGLTALRFNLAALEPFDAWALRGGVLAATLIAITGLGVSLFVPMAYCRFACPTGALLKFLRSTGSSDHFGARDWAALLLILAGSASVYWPAGPVPAQAAPNISELNGICFGTTWSVKIRDGSMADKDLPHVLATELERIESTLSHWRTNSATSRFNASRSTQPMEMPQELATLVSHALDLSRASDGAFDITVAPLVQAWGFGPKGTLPHAPGADEIIRLRACTGWEKLTANTNTHTLQKAHPELQIDLGAILQGYAADRLAALLDESGNHNYLIDVGGELLAKGRWRVAIEDPAEPQRLLRTLFLQDMALSTSGTYRAKHADGKKRWSHLINPRTGDPVQHDTTLVSVLHSSCASADAWATTLIVTGGEQAVSLAETNGIPLLMVSGGKVTACHFPENLK